MPHRLNKYNVTESKKEGDGEGWRRRGGEVGREKKGVEARGMEEKGELCPSEKGAGSSITPI